MDVFDVHHHVGSLSSPAGVPGGHDQTGVADEMQARIEIMDRGGVRQAAVIPGHGYLRPNGHADTRAVNDQIASYRDLNPGRFPVAIGIVEPRDGDVTFGEIDRCRDELGLVGLSFHPRFQGVSIDNGWISSYVGHMATCGLVPVIHALNETVEESVWKVGQLADEFPDVTMLVLDGYSTYEGTKQCSYLARRHENLIFDTSLSLHSEFVVQDIKRFGSHRFVFGTDLYSPPLGYRISHVLDELLESDLDDDSKAAVLGGTARRLFGVTT